MSKGLGKLQRAIVGLLDGSIKPQVWRLGGVATTTELLDELLEMGLIDKDAEKKIAMFNVRRACHTLLARGILEGEYTIHCDYPWAKVASWRIAHTR